MTAYTVEVPRMVVAVPAGSRTRKLVWSRAPITIVPANERTGDIRVAMSYRADDGAATSSVYRVDDEHYRQVDRRSLKTWYGADGVHNAANIARNMREVLLREAGDWVSRNLTGEIKSHPDAMTHNNIHNVLNRLPLTSDTSVKDIDVEQTEAYAEHMRRIAEGFLVVGHDLYERCAEPTYAVVRLGSVITVRVCTDEIPETHSGTLALFPIGSFDEAAAFALATAEPRGGTYGETVTDMRDCGECVRNDAETRSMIMAARNAVGHFQREYTADYSTAAAKWRLLNETNLDDIHCYRMLMKYVEDYEKDGDIAFDGLSLYLRRAATCGSSAVFTNSSTLPLEAISDMWDDRPISVSPASPGPSAQRGG